MNFLAQDQGIFARGKGEKVYSEQVLTDLTVASRADIGLNSGDEIVLILSEDGKGYVPEWAQAAQGAEVYVEVRSSAKGMTFHGWVDKASRRIVQAG